MRKFLSRLNFSLLPGLALPLKIAAGIVIGLLAYQLIMLKLIDYQHAELGDALNRAANLKIQATNLRNAIHAYHHEHGELPQRLDQLTCPLGRDCEFRQSGERFFSGSDGEWIAQQPYLDRDNLRFHCWSTLSPLYDPDYDRCGKLDPAQVPDPGSQTGSGA